MELELLGPLGEAAEALEEGVLALACRGQVAPPPGAGGQRPGGPHGGAGRHDDRGRDREPAQIEQTAEEEHGLHQRRRALSAGEDHCRHVVAQMGEQARRPGLLQPGERGGEHPPGEVERKVPPHVLSEPGQARFGQQLGRRHQEGEPEEAPELPGGDGPRSAHPLVGQGQERARPEAVRRPRQGARRGQPAGTLQEQPDHTPFGQGSITVSRCPAATPVRVCTAPEGQRTTTLSAILAAPRPRVGSIWDCER